MVIDERGVTYTHREIGGTLVHRYVQGEVVVSEGGLHVSTARGARHAQMRRLEI